MVGGEVKSFLVSREGNTGIGTGMSFFSFGGWEKPGDLVTQRQDNVPKDVHALVPEGWTEQCPQGCLSPTTTISGG